MKRVQFYKFLTGMGVLLTLTGAGCATKGSAVSKASPVAPVSDAEQATPAAPSSPVPSGAIEVTEMAIARDIQNREPVEKGSEFAISTGRIFAFTRVKSKAAEGKIKHVWYFRNQPVATVELSVRGSPWRTYSSKVLESGQAGAWRVDVLDENGALLKSQEFTVTP